MSEHRWKFEIEFEKKVEMECLVKTMVLDTSEELGKIGKGLNDILTKIRANTNDLIVIDETVSPLFIQLKDLISRIEYEDRYLEYFSKIDGTVSQFASGLKVHDPPKYRPFLPARAKWT